MCLIFSQFLQKKSLLISNLLFSLLYGLMVLPAFAEENQSRLASFLNGFDSSSELLAADDAFRLELYAQDNKLLAQWQIADGYYMYKKQLEVFSDTARKHKITVQKQLGKLKSDPLFGDVYVFYNQTEVALSPQQLQGLTALTFRYQGCADLGVCYPPQTQTINLQDFLPLIGVGNTQANTLQATDIISETDEFNLQLIQGNFLLTLGLFFITGLLLAFTPCVFPMIPILSGIIANKNESVNTPKAFRISLVYVLAVAFTYTTAGVIAALLGENLQAALQKPWVLTSFAFIFVILALSMFNFYRLELPQQLTSRLNSLATKQHKGSYIGVATIGFLSALIIGPCVAPPLAGALLYIGQTGDAVLGGSALFMLSFGMGTPLLLFGTAAGKWLPKSGKWLATVKAVLGFILLAMAIWILDRIMPTWISMLLWGGLFIIMAIYMGAFERLDITPKRSWNALFKGMGWLSFLFGTMLFISAMSGGQSIIQPLKHLVNNQTVNTPALTSYFKKTPTGEALQHALASAKSMQKPSMIYITAEWCITCKELDLITFNNDDVIKAMGEDNIFKVDVTKHTEMDQQFQQSMQIIGPPTILFYDSQGKEIRNFRVIGMIMPNDFIKRIKLWQSS